MRNHRLDRYLLCRGLCVLGYCLLVVASPVKAGAPEAQSAAPVNAAGYVEDYLSDRRRAGSLVGSILGGALTAHPLGPVLGSVFGFLIGKSTMHEVDTTAAPTAVARLDPRRAIVPSDGGAAAALSFDQGSTVSFDQPAAAPAQALAPAIIAGRANSAPQNTQAITAGPVIGPESGAPSASVTPFGLAAAPGAAVTSRQQIAALCSNGAGQFADPRLRNACFYFRGN